LFKKHVKKHPAHLIAKAPRKPLDRGEKDKKKEEEVKTGWIIYVKLIFYFLIYYLNLI